MSKKQSYTGTYKWDAKQGRMVKLSSAIPDTQVFDVSCPEGGYYSDNLETYVESRAHKRRLLKEKGFMEYSNLSRREI